MLEFNVFNYDFERLGTIEHYQSVTITRNYYERSVLELTIEASERNIELLQLNNVITTITNVNYGYIIRHFSYSDNNSELITILAYSLNHLFNWRTIALQEIRSGNVETILKQFIANQCITPSDANRIIPRLVLSANSGINITTESMITGKNLEDFVWEFCQKHEMTVDILMNHQTKRYEVFTWSGEDKSEGNTFNPIKFSKEFENIQSVEFVRDESVHRTTAYVAGEGEGIAREIVIVNGSFSGLDRKEIFIDARNLQSTYYDSNNVEITMPIAEYRSLLNERGLEELSEMNIIETFEGEVIDTQFVYGIDYSLGDIVSFRSERLKMILHTRVTSVTTTIDSDNKVSFSVAFGNKIPTLLDKIKKVVVK